jgi:hypothetical protein
MEIVAKRLLRQEKGCEAIFSPFRFNCAMRQRRFALELWSPIFISVPLRRLNAIMISDRRDFSSFFSGISRCSEQL